MDKKRKLYGGYALNLLIEDKSKNDAIYKDDDREIHDMDCYTPDPINDLIEICNMLYNNGIKNIQGKEAQHQETYTIRVENKVYCDLSYVPNNIYHKLPFKEIKGIYVSQPIWLTIDYYRMFTDPLTSYWRIDNDLKAFKRFVLLQKHYTLPYVSNSLEIKTQNTFKEMAFKIIEKFIQNKESIVNIGYYAYNYIIKESKILENKNTNKNAKKFKYVNIPYYEMISTNYKLDFYTLMKTLKSDGLLLPKISYIEFSCCKKINFLY